MKRPVFLLLLVFWTARLLAQSPVFRNYNALNGLPSSEVYCSLQDSRGYMWFGTDRGIVKFDGQHFQVFSSKDGLPDNTFFNLLEDDRHRIWFLSYSSKTGYIKDDHVYTYPYTSKVKRMVPHQIITYIHTDHNDNTWINWDTGPQSNIICIRRDGSIDSSFNWHSTKTRRLYITRNGECMASGNKFMPVVEVIMLDTWKTIAVLSSENTVPGNQAWYLEKNGRTWLFLDNKLLLLQNGSARKVLACGNERVLSLAIDRTDNIWIGYVNRGVEVYSPKNNYRSCSETLLKKHSVSSLLEDREGGLWFTTLENGIYYLAPASPLSYDERDGLSVPKVKRVQKIDKDIVLILSNRDYAIIDHRKPGLQLLKQYTDLGLDLRYLPPDRIYYSGFRQIRLPFKKKMIYLPNPEKIHLGKRWVWGFSICDLYRYDRDGRMLENISFHAISRIKCLFEKQDGKLLVGTLDGLYEYDAGKITALKRFHPQWSRRISGIERIDRTHVAISTIGNGVMIIPENDYTHPITYTEQDGLPSSMCHALCCENDSELWVGTNKGLCRLTHALDPSKAKFYQTDVSDGLVSNEINDISISDDTLLLGTMNGLTLLPKKHKVSKQYPIPVYIEKVSVNGKMLDGHPSELSYEHNNISIAYTALDYQYSSKLWYKYRLLPGNREWSYTNNRSVIYNALAPGNYTFELTAINPGKPQMAAVSTWSFHILAPFWQTWWFALLVLLLLVSAMYLFVHYRVRFVKDQVQMKNDLKRFREKALRAQMNPHFIYNSLNSIQSYILRNDSLSSAFFLSKFSGLMRLTFTNTSLELVSLEKDLEALYLYIELESLRFPGRFDLHVSVSPAIDQQKTLIPPLVIQPFIENAILHGILTRSHTGNIWLDISKSDYYLDLCIRDDGIGRERAREIREKKEKYEGRKSAEKRRSSGIITTNARIEQAWGKGADQSVFSITDLYDETQAPAGTMVQFSLPLSYDQSYYH